MPITPLPPASPSYPGQPYDPRAERILQIATNVGSALDRNRDGVLGRDEFTGSQFARVDQDGNGALTQDELKQALGSLDDTVLEAMRINAMEGRGAIESRHDTLKNQGKSAIAIGGLSGTLAAAFLRLRPWALGAVAIPATLVAAAGAYVWATQPAKDARVRDRLTTYMDDALQNKVVATDLFQVSTPLGDVAEKVIGSAAYALSLPGKIVRDLLPYLGAFRWPWQQH